MCQRPVEGTTVALGEPRGHGAVLLPPVEVGVVGKKQLAEERCEGHGHQQGHEQRHKVGNAEGFEHTALQPVEEEERHKGYHDDEGGMDDGASYFGRAMEDHTVCRVALLGRQLVVLTKTFVDVLHIDDGIVDQRADGYAHAAEGHRVDFVPHEIETQHCAQQ